MLALASHPQLIEGRQIDGSQGFNVAVQEVDLALQSPGSNGPINDGTGERFEVCLCLPQQLVVLLKAQTRSLLLELKVRDALAQGIEFTLDFQPALIAGAQAQGQVIVLTALGCQHLLTLKFDGQCTLQSGLRRSVIELREFLIGLFNLGTHRRGLVACRLNCPGQLLATR